MEWYEKHHKTLFIAPILLVLLAVGVILFTTAETGSFVRKGVSLAGGVSATVTLTDDVSIDGLRAALLDTFPDADIDVRGLRTFGETRTFIVDAADMHPDEQEAADLLEAALRSQFSVSDLTLETTGPSLGDAFFIQTIIGILLAFLWMGWVVFLYFGRSTMLKVVMALLALTFTILSVQGVLSGNLGVLVLGIAVLLSMAAYFFFSVPSGAVILAAASTILFTLAVINLLGIRLSTAGVAAFLMLIGYSVDTDILLSTRVLKEPHRPLNERIVGAFKTGITMQFTTIAAVLIAYILSTSEVIQQIMLIILIGMIGDIIFTWMQNAGIIYWYVQSTERKVQATSHVVRVSAPDSKRAKRRRR